VPGDVDAAYVLARRTLLDALDALGVHREVVILAGAQAIYLHTRNAELDTVPYTTDVDLAVDPADLLPLPLIDDAMAGGGFTPRAEPGGWISSDGIYVDLLVPEQLAGAGRRGADIGVHGRKRARRARGLEGALVDRVRRTIDALDPSDLRTATLWVAGPGALLVAKIHKIEDRIPRSRTSDKDALDVLRLLRAIDTATLVDHLMRLRVSRFAGPVTEHAVGQLPILVGDRNAPGVSMAVSASSGDEDHDTIAASMIALAMDLVDACG